MGASVLEHLDIAFNATKTEVAAIPSALDTQAVVAEYCNKNVDLIIFAGGDGTAADVAQTIARLNPAQIALGIPAGVKIQSGVFAINPAAAGQLVAALANGELLHVESAQVRDLDEFALQKQQVKSRYLGSMLVPYDGRFVQSIKQGGLVAEELIIADIAAYLTELIPEDATVVFGPGKTMADLQEAMGLPNSLLGFDVFAHGRCLALDADERHLSNLLAGAADPWVFLTVIGGQGHIIGRGNQQLSADTLKSIGRAAIHPIATKEKLASLSRGKLLIDSGDSGLDKQWQGLMPVICGYREQVLYDLVYMPH
jgi:predicted polyphosphate/ATP-dependent NAD kinase